MENEECYGFKHIGCSVLGVGDRPKVYGSSSIVHSLLKQRVTSCELRKMEKLNNG